MKRKRLKFPLLKILICGLCTVPLLSSAQSSKKVLIPSSQRQLYLMTTYRLNMDQVNRYEAALKEKVFKENEVKNKVISYSLYKEEITIIQRAFRQAVLSVFTTEQYAAWKRNTRTSEWYRFLGEELYIPEVKLLEIMDVNDKYTDSRSAIWAGSLSELDKNRKNDELGKEFRRAINRILGESKAQEFMYEKLVQADAVRNMDKYKISYNEGLKIAETERNFYQQREGIKKSGLHGSDFKEAIAINDEKKRMAVSSSVSGITSSRWRVVNANALDYSLANVYDLNTAQIAMYKEYYNEYLVVDYKIYRLKIPVADKSAMWSDANQEFLAKVKPLFSAEAYARWYGKHMFDFERKIKTRIKQNDM